MQYSQKVKYSKNKKKTEKHIDIRDQSFCSDTLTEHFESAEKYQVPISALYRPRTII